MTQPGLVNKLRAQDRLVLRCALRAPLALNGKCLARLWQTSVATTERQSCVERHRVRLSTRWITLTVTEKGYTPALAQLLDRRLAFAPRGGSWPA
jgi:fructuronate reductase